jgi:transcriptional regulator with XRE-family HTH domain
MQTQKSNSKNNENSALQIGAKIKAFRKNQNTTIKQISEKVGVSESYISQLEHNKVNPSLGTLKKLATALGVNMVDFFSNGSSEDDVVVRKNQRRKIVYPGGQIHGGLMASNISTKTMEPLYTTIEPGGDTVDPYRHGENSEEFGVVIKGELLLVVDGVEYHLKQGDSFYFKSSQPHRWANLGKVTTEVVWVITPPSF